MDFRKIIDNTVKMPVVKLIWALKRKFIYYVFLYLLPVEQQHIFELCIIITIRLLRELL